MRRKRIALVALAVVAVAAPAWAQGDIDVQTDTQPQLFSADQEHPFGLAPWELAYLRTRDRVEDSLGENEAGRNIVTDGVFVHGADQARVATRADVLAATKRLRDELELAEVLEGYPAPFSGFATEATVQCESGGDYTIDTGNGFYGGYQFMQSTWDAYAPEPYVGVKPSEAPPEVQDAVAASLPSDQWPNC